MRIASYWHREGPSGAWAKASRPQPVEEFPALPGGGLLRLDQLMSMGCSMVFVRHSFSMFFLCFVLGLSFSLSRKTCCLSLQELTGHLQNDQPLFSLPIFHHFSIIFPSGAKAKAGSKAKAKAASKAASKAKATPARGLVVPKTWAKPNWHEEQKMALWAGEVWDFGTDETLIWNDLDILSLILDRLDI